MALHTAYNKAKAAAPTMAHRPAKEPLAAAPTYVLIPSVVVLAWLLVD